MREIRDANASGGVRFRTLKGYRVDERVYFAFKTEIVAPAGTGISPGAFFDVPAPNFRFLVGR